MPKPYKTKSKQKVKPKLKRKKPEFAGITTRKSYWITLTILLAVVSAVFGIVMGIGLLQIAILIAAIIVLIGFIGFIRVSPSTLSFSKRATFLFIGASVIGFGIWAAIVLLSNATGFTAQIENSLGNQFFAVTSLAICITGGAFIGEVIGKNKNVQERLFPPKMDD